MVGIKREVVVEVKIKIKSIIIRFLDEEEPERRTNKKIGKEGLLMYLLKWLLSCTYNTLSTM